MHAPDPDPAAAWIEAAMARHTTSLSRPEFLKAVRALSARYVERRSELGQRSPTDSAGKRAAFAGFFAPIHYLTARAAVRALEAGARPIETILDLGCGTGVASAAWAGECPGQPSILGIDREGWSLDEAAWTWRTLGLRGRTKRGDFVALLDEQTRAHARHANTLGIVLGWSVNELSPRDRGTLRAQLVALMERGAAVLVIEPISRSAVPWWDEWVAAWSPAGGRSDEWKFEDRLPALLASSSESAGFRRESLSARTLFRAVSAGPAK